MRIIPVPCLKDNYAYLVVCEATGRAAIVDPSEAEPVLEAVKREGVTLAAIWNTHHHWDHVGGNKGLLDAYPELEVVGHGSDRGRIDGQTRFVDEGDQVTLGEEVQAEIIHNPGHTSGAISFYIRSEPAVFTGDTLFCAGCGRLFEGSPAEMHASLSKLAALPDETRVYCGHEYTQKNLAFAAAVEPESAAIAERRKKVDALRDKGEPSVPSTIAEEKESNPFLRAEVDAVARAVAERDPDAKGSPEAVFAGVRRWKDSF